MFYKFLRAHIIILALVLSSFGFLRQAAGSHGFPDNATFQAFVNKAAKCADRPVPSLLYKSASTGSENRLATLNVEATWLTGRTRNVNDVTVCTNTGPERLYMLRGQCESWNGPMSAIIYVGLEIFNTSNTEKLEALQANISRLHAELESNELCSIDITLVSELMPAERLWAYPYNSVRKQAIARARTRLIILLDVDFLLTTGLRQRLLQEPGWSAMMHDTHVNKDVIVLPAFETKPRLPLDEGKEIAENAIRSTKDDLKRLFDKEHLVRFAPFYDRGHTATNYPRWFSTDDPYSIEWRYGYEPFVMMARQHVPWYDERFRGYGWDKITHTYQLVHTGFQLVAHPSGFVVHRPHLPSAGYNQTFTGEAYTKSHKPTQELKKLDVIAKEMMNDVRKQLYPDLGVTSLAGCRPLEVLEGWTEPKLKVESDTWW